MGYTGKACSNTWMDDIIVITPDFQTHKQSLEEVFLKLHQAGFELKPTKCEFLLKEVR